MATHIMYASTVRGLLVRGTLTGLIAGLFASLALSFVLGRAGRFSPRVTAALTAAGALALVYLVPFPPAVGNPDTIGQRTTLFFLMILLSVLLGVGAIILGRLLAHRTHPAGTAAAAPQPASALG
ncbi:CbtA family protein [Streptomyces sp. NPDC004327]|uniref:CbtA family protein n=1 Tax=Streptomyces sp. NPDC004327 TaxID=3364699 RepID=UPI003690B44C